MLTNEQVDAAIGRLERSPVAVYVEIQKAVSSADLSADGEFAGKFCRFYRVRRSKKFWRPAFFHRMSVLRRSTLQAPLPSFGEVLRALADDLPKTERGNRRVEASFASKMLATLDPERPILDSVVLKYYRLSLPTSGTEASRIENTIEVFNTLESNVKAELDCSSWRERRLRFDEAFSDIDLNYLTDVKALDFMIWASRDDEPEYED